MNLIDMHCDTIWKLMDHKTGNTLRNNSGSVDLAGMRHAKTMAQFFACFIYMKEFRGKNRYTEGFEHALRMTEWMKREVLAEETELAFAYCYEDILKNQKADKISVILTIEEGGIVEGKPERLKELYEAGVRVMTILWNEENCMGFPNSRDKTVMQKGLKPFGLETVERMNDLGMVIDVSHLSDGGFWDVLRMSRKPVAATHSNARSLCPHPRNLTDEMMRALAEKGGVAGLNFYPYFLNPSGKAGIEDLVRHMVHMVHVGGIEFAAIGTDFDGFDEGENEITHISQMERLFEGLKKEGFTEGQLEKIWSGNVLRLLGTVCKK